ncbi:MAG: DinB family protein [Saprospiraceae bacterium]|nr:DinB family protein [Saprospiraceae bacterium]
MYLQKLISNYTAYNQWCNESLVQWLSGKPEADFYKQVASSYPSMALTLNHILAVQEFWYSVITENAPVSMRYMETQPDHKEILQELPQQSALLNAYISSLSETDLLQQIHLDTPWVKGTLPRYEFIQHLFNHSTYHRGQAVTIGRSLGYEDAPMTDYNFYNMVALKRGVEV